MGNPMCPKCGRIMSMKALTTDMGEFENGDKRLGRAKFWVCPNKGVLHGKVKFRVGAETIPRPKKVN